MDNNGTTTGKPAYVAWRTFYNFIGKLKETVIPPTIDKSVMKGMSGASRSQITIAMRWLGLISDGGATTDRLEDLVNAHGNEKEWRTILRQVLADSYTELVGDVDLDKGTGTELAARFREHGLTGATLAKAVRFYLGAMDSAGLEYSPHISAPSVERKQRKKTPKRQAAENGKGSAAGDDDEDSDEHQRFSLTVVPDGWVPQPFVLPGREHFVSIIMPTDLTAREWQMISAYMDLYVKDENE